MTLFKNPAFFINPFSGGGRGQKRFEDFLKTPVGRSFHFNDSEICQSPKQIQSWLNICLRRGQRFFVAAGGDGTVHFFLNQLVPACEALEIPLEEIIFGAIALGSSNDFHKNPLFHSKPQAKSYLLDPSEVKTCDLMKISLQDQVIYSALNSSVGLTSQANDFFNQPDFVLKKLKNISTSAAIGYAAFRSFLRWRSENVQVWIDNEAHGQMMASNIGVVKSPYFAGGFRYPYDVQKSSEKMGFYFSGDKSSLQLMSSMISLAKGQFPESQTHWQKSAQQVRVQFQEPTAIEIDGEVYRSSQVEWRIHSQKIRVAGPL